MNSSQKQKTFIAKFDRQEIGSFTEALRAIESLEQLCELKENDIKNLYEVGYAVISQDGRYVTVEIEET